MSRDGKSTAQRLVQARTGRDLAEHLRELYVERRFSDQEIATAFGVSRSAVRKWRTDLGIERSERPAVAV